MSISASEREDWVGSESDQMDSSGHSDLQKELMSSTTQAIFSHVDGAEAHGYVRSPPVEETIAATVRHQPSLEAMQVHCPPR